MDLSHLPVEVVLDNVLPCLPVPDLLRLSSTNRFFSQVCSDDTLWKRKLEDDFNFSGHGTARVSGWKYIYRGLSSPRVYVWGDRANRRLGLDRYPRTLVAGVPFPSRLRIPNSCIVRLVAGGMSFHALDSVGYIHVWGTLNGADVMSPQLGFANPSQEAATPMTLLLPAPVRSISCGRLHSSCLDRDGTVWTFTNWGHPFSLTSPLLVGPDVAPTQIECGWGFSSMLTKSGNVFVWWPMDGQMQSRIRQHDEQELGKRIVVTDRRIHCETWSLEMDPVQLPPLPRLPELTRTGVNITQDVQLKQIAGIDSYIIGLTNHGHVLKFGPLHNDSISSATWEYLPNFSEVEKLSSFEPFSGGEHPIPSPQTMQITHVTGNFMKFTAYSTGESSIVLLGDTDTVATSPPQIIPELQHKNVISVVLGDYHRAALTASGKLMTWGQYSAGALGLGDPTKLETGVPGGFDSERQRTESLRRGRWRPQGAAVDTPTEVRFDHGRKKRKDRFCFSATAAGWHTGALVIDLEPDEHDDDDSESELDFGGDSARMGGMSNLPPRWEHWETPPIASNVFRIGFAGRGNFRGQLGRGRGGV